MKLDTLYQALGLVLLGTIGKEFEYKSHIGVMISATRLIWIRVKLKSNSYLKLQSIIQSFI